MSDKMPSETATAVPAPTRIQKHSDTDMEVAWANGDITIVPYAELRFQCRCAQCVDEWTSIRKITRDRVRADIRPTKVEMVGRYAIQIDWNDGHKTGIYPFELLYRIARGEVTK